VQNDFCNIISDEAEIRLAALARTKWAWPKSPIPSDHPGTPVFLQRLQEGD
jgi:hypothetical protein